MFIAFAIYSQSEQLDSPTVFTSLAIFNILRQPLTFIPIIADSLVKALVSFERIESFLQQPGLEPIQDGKSPAHEPPDQNELTKIELKDKQVR